MAEKTTYGTVFKTTFLFGFVQVFNAIVAIFKNKIVAILIGAEGIGLLSIFGSTMRLLQTGAGLGVNQSAVRDVSEANGKGNRSRISRIISVTNKVVLFTGLLGCMITLVLSYWLSDWTLDSHAYVISYCILGIAVACNIMNDGKMAIIKGVRHLKSLAKASIIGTLVGLFTAIPLYYFFGKDGIVPEILISSILALLTSQYFVNKISVDKVKLSFKEAYIDARSMVKIGCALMFVSFVTMFVSVVINSYMISNGGLKDVGFYNAGVTILNSYFGLVITALMTDYYPRISSVNKDNNLLQDELNKQAKVSLVLCCPMCVLFMVYSSIAVQLLYTSEFEPAVDYLRFGIYWTLITICSNQIDLILVAKGEVRIFTVIALSIRAIQIVACIGLYKYFGLLGLGISYAFLGVIHMTIMTTVVYKKYRICFDSTFIKLAIVELLFAISATILSFTENQIINYTIGSVLIILSFVFSYYTTKRILGINIFKFLRTRLVKK